MTRPAHRPPGARAALLAGSLGLALTACAQAGGATPVRGLRVVVDTVAEVGELDAFMRRVAQAAGVTVRDAVYVGEGRRSAAVTLECRDATDCDRAYARLDAERGWIAALRRDAMRGLPQPIRP